MVYDRTEPKIFPFCRMVLTKNLIKNTSNIGKTKTCLILGKNSEASRSIGLIKELTDFDMTWLKWFRSNFGVI